MIGASQQTNPRKHNMIFKKQTLVATFPAYDIFEREAGRDGIVNITADDTLGLEKRGYYKTFSPGSVVSYALQYNEDPIAAVEAARAKRHALHWINARGAMLTAHDRPKETLVLVRYGMKVRFEGLIATIEADHNDNLKLVPVAATAAA